MKFFELWCLRSDTTLELALTQTTPLLSRLPAFGEDGTIHVVIETPKGSPNKYAYSDAFGAFQFKMVLPDGMSFPYDFGMVPSTKGDDGDPLDILILLDAPAFPGCVLEARLVGVIEADQRERDGTWERNDRLIGVALKARTHAHIRGLSDLRPGMLDEVDDRPPRGAPRVELVRGRPLHHG